MGVVLALPDCLVVKNLPANAGDAGAAGSIPGWGRSPGGGNGNPLSILAGKIPWTGEPRVLQSLGLLRVGQDWAFTYWLTFFVSFEVENIFLLFLFTLFKQNLMLIGIYILFQETEKTPCTSFWRLGFYCYILKLHIYKYIYTHTHIHYINV